jgi:outer membrane protein TolC
MSRATFLLAAFFAVTDTAWAEPPVLRLTDVIEQAVKKNPTLLEAGADLGVAEGNLLSAEGIDDFQLDLVGRYSRNEATLLPNSQQVQEPSVQDFSGELDLTRNLPTGGSLGLRFTTDHNRGSFFDPTVPEGMRDSLTVTTSPSLELVWNQPLLRGLGYSAARGALRKAREARSAAALTKAATAATVLRDLTNAYVELAFANEDLAVRHYLAQAARDQLAIVDANIKAGKMPPSARAEVEVATGSREDDVFISQKSVLDQSLVVRLASGMPIGAGETLIVTGAELDISIQVPSIEEALRRAHDGNPQLLAAQAQGRTARVDVEVTDNGVLPQLDLSVTAGPLGSSDDAGTAFDQMVHFDSYAVTAQLAYHDTLGRRGVRGTAKAAHETWRKTQLTVADIRAQVDLAVVQLQSFAVQAQHRLDVLTPTGHAADLDLAAERARFEVGRSTNFDVLRRQQEVAEARLRAARARADLLEARAGLEAATGEILTRYGVVIK